MPSANQLLFCNAPSIPLFIKVSCQIFTLITYAYCMSCCWMQVASQGLKEVHILCKHSPASAVSFVSLQMCHCKLWNTFQTDSKKRHFIVMLKLIHPTDHIVMKEPVCFIGYAIWISIGCHASYPMVTGCISCSVMYMQSMMCHLTVLMKRIKYEDPILRQMGNAISTLDNHICSALFHTDF